MVSARGDNRSCGNVSQDGKAATWSGPSRSASADDSTSTSRPVGTTASTGRSAPPAALSAASAATTSCRAAAGPWSASSAAPARSTTALKPGVDRAADNKPESTSKQGTAQHRRPRLRARSAPFDRLAVMKRFRVTAAVLASLSVLLTSCSEDASGNEPPPGAIKGDQRSHSQGKIKVTEVAEGLKVGWDIGFLPSGNVLLPQRPGKLSAISPKKKGQKITDITDPKQTTVTDVKIDLPKPYVKAEGGLLGMVLHPDFEKSRKFTLCQTTATPDGKPNDIRLITWKLSKDEKSATKVKDLITGLPLGPTGQHVGCRPTEGPDGELLIGTGDGWHLNTAQDKNNLGGKVLRVDWDTGK